MNVDLILHDLDQLPASRWTQGFLRRRDRYCTIGWLLHCAGCEPDDRLSYVEPLHLELLRQEYGLARDTIFVLMERNDTAVSWTDARRAMGLALPELERQDAAS